MKISMYLKIVIWTCIILILNFIDLHSNIFKNNGAIIKITDDTKFIVKDADVINDTQDSNNGTFILYDNALVSVEQSFYNYSDVFLQENSKMEITIDYINFGFTTINLQARLHVLANVYNSGNIENEFVIEVGQE